MRLPVLVAVSLLLSASPLLAQEVTDNKTPTGQTYMQTPQGAALYVFDKDRGPGDVPGPSTCYDQCAQLWPPFLDTSDAKPHGDWTIETRKDGGKQWAYKKRPLYTFVRDTKPGQIQGDGFNGNTWHLAEP